MSDKTNINEYIWTRFEQAIDECFLADGKLPHTERRLSKVLSEFWQCASNPRVQALNLLATHSLFAKNNYRMKVQGRMETEIAIIDICPNTKWFELHIFIGANGLSIRVNSKFGKEHTAYATKVGFTKLGIKMANELIDWWFDMDEVAYNDKFIKLERPEFPNYQMMLWALVAKGVAVCEQLDTAIADTLAEQ